jgi:hypothetical protein
MYPLDKCLNHVYRFIMIIIIYSPLMKFEVSEHHLGGFSDNQIRLTDCTLTIRVPASAKFQNNIHLLWCILIIFHLISLTNIN